MSKRTILGAATLVGIASAWTSAHAELLDRTRFKGNQAVTSFTGSTTIGCEDGSEKEFVADGFVFGSQTLTRMKGSAKNVSNVSNGIFVSASFFNGCTGESRFLVGAIAGGFEPPDAALNRARLEGSTLLQDVGDGAQVSFQLEVVIEGVGEIVAGKSGSHSKTQDTPTDPVVITQTLSAHASRDAVAVGTIRLAGRILAPELSFSGLAANSNAEIRIER